MGIFSGSGINEATTGSGRRYLDPGIYVIKVTKCGQVSAKDSGKGVPSFFIELEVMQSSNKSCPAGTVASWAQPIKADKEQAKLAVQNVKQFLAAGCKLMTIFDTPDPVTGLKPDAEKFADAVCTAAQPFAGVLIGVKVTGKTLRNGSDFSKHDWYPAV